ncbi:MAG TPA: WYL domain-containing protein [Polyangiaceae bacterium]|nr:WYL domain-containing protein [Polyangiaceae bacterium]
MQARPRKKGKVELTPHRRIDRVKEMLASHPRGISLYELSETLAVDPRTMRRYLKEIEREYELSPVRARGGGPCLWRIHPRELPRKVEMRRPQAYALLATRRMFDSLQGSALFDEIDMAVGKLRAFADRPGRGVNAGLSNARLEERFVYLPRLARDYSDKSEELDELFLAVSELRPLSLRYPRTRKLREERGRDEKGREEKVTIHPYALVLYQEGVYCVGFVPAREEIGTFALDRMRDVQALPDERFDLPQNFRVEDHFEGEFGVAAPKQPTKVVLELDAATARSMRDIKIHPSQKASATPGGGLRVTLHVDDALSLVSYVLGLGSGAQVLEPEPLREQLRSELGLMLASYVPSDGVLVAPRK